MFLGTKILVNVFRENHSPEGLVKFFPERLILFKENIKKEKRKRKVTETEPSKYSKIFEEWTNSYLCFNLWGKLFGRIEVMLILYI